MVVKDIERQETLRAHFASASPWRPIMTSLNGDNSWLLSFPRPEPERASTGKCYYHILFEPWLNGPTSLFSSWFIHLAHPQSPAFAGPETVNAWVRQIETEAAAVAGLSKQAGSKNGGEKERPEVDAILLGFHYLDHLHQPTLLQFDPRIPVIATPEARAVLEPWDHFKTVLTIPSLDPMAKSWRSDAAHPGDPFPSWLAPVRLLGHHELNYVTALVWTHATSDGGDVHEAILQTPHGTKLDVGPLQAFLDSEPRAENLALLHGLKESRAMGSMNTFGAAGGLALYRKIGGAKYWLQTHHAALVYSGIMMRLLWVHDTPKTIQWALEKEAQESGNDVEHKGGRPNVIEVDNGGCFVLA
ncbi:uncharacterized protein Z520_10014 [Fonsecaea multimorphosa CBS 102226]|uniref:Uncharacterized protein n=1 Tax=Fonsecaea multimorphosa CBS 102226 TaxID=1442371 RepID=A0A0D2JUU8_9EURO|nr:uncharacterized protein Z520_10014 [Fonsecaea multimorphosa CBS 102226]KIX94304.1 hypothetical protein Z520_10014 [Fonsecaea multimorphosa CBS 102226]OAL19705.1 hypothetical protein AYO22_09511 [Fonsecaea multimorphosa]